MSDFEAGQLVKFKYDPDLDPPIEGTGGPYGPWRKGYPLFGHVTGFGLAPGVTLTTPSGELSADSSEALGDYGLAPSGIEVELLNIVGPAAMVHVAPERLLDPDHRDPSISRRCEVCGFIESFPVDFKAEPFICPNGCESEGEVSESDG